MIRGKKYLIMPGYVFSADGDKHYINASMLMGLYKVPQNECLIFNEKLSDRFYKGLIVLAPMNNGDYSLEGRYKVE